MRNWKNILKPMDENKKFWECCILIATLILIVAIAINTWNESKTVNKVSEKIVWLSYIYNVIISLTTFVLGMFLLNITPLYKFKVKKLLRKSWI